MMQLDLFAAPPEPTPMGAARPFDAVADKLVRGGWCANQYLIALAGCHPASNQRYGGHWDLPSRLMQFPIETTNALYEDDGQTRVYLRHPLLSEHPWVIELQEALGAPLETIEGYGNHAIWWHAVDLGSEDRWNDLLETERFTTRGDISGAVAHCLRYKRSGFNAKRAREVLAAIDSEEPEPTLDGLSAPSICDKRWPINGRFRAWHAVHGIEQGWFKYRGEFLEWGEAGRTAWEAVA